MSAKQLSPEEIEYLNEIKLIGTVGFGIFSPFSTIGLPNFESVTKGEVEKINTWKKGIPYLLDFSCVPDETIPELNIDGKVLLPIALAVNVVGPPNDKYLMPLSGDLIDPKTFTDLTSNYTNGRIDWRWATSAYALSGINLKFYVCAENNLLYGFSSKLNKLFVLTRVGITEHTYMHSIVFKDECISFLNDFNISVCTPEVLRDELAENKEITKTFCDPTNLFDPEEVDDVECENRSTLVEGQEDGLIDASDLTEELLHYISGSEENLEHDTTMIFHALFPLKCWDNYVGFDLGVVYRSSTDDGREAFYDEEETVWQNDLISDGLEASQHSALAKTVLADALTVAISENYPQGHNWEYNDGPYDRQSGYDKEQLRVEIKIQPPSAHDQIAAKLELSQRANVYSKELIDRIEKVYTLLNDEQERGIR